MGRDVCGLTPFLVPEAGKLALLLTHRRRRLQNDEAAVKNTSLSSDPQVLELPFGVPTVVVGFVNRYGLASSSYLGRPSFSSRLAG